MTTDPRTCNARLPRLPLALLAAGSLLAFPAGVTAQQAAGSPQPLAPQQARKLRPRWMPTKPAHATIAPSEDPTRLVLKLRDGSRGRARGGSLRASVSGPDLMVVRAILDRFPSARVEPLFAPPAEVLDDLREAGQERSGQELAELSQFFQVHLPAGADAVGLLDRLLARDEVENAYAAPAGYTLPGDIAPLTPDYSNSNNQLFNHHQIDWASGVPGGTGAGSTIVDVEASWNLKGLFGDLASHEDLTGLDAQSTPVPVGDPSIWVNPFGDTHHGTGVLGLLSADVDSWGIDGIATGATVRVNTAHTSAGWNVPAGILVAALNAGPGGIVLVELQVNGPNAGNPPCSGDPQFGSVPVEYYDAEFAVIQLAVSLGVHVIEPAGNGKQDLDDDNGGVAGTPCVATGHPSYSQKFDPAVRYSGAAMVGSIHSNYSGRFTTSNHGSRVDLHSWGENLTTLGYGFLFNGGADQLYLSTYGETSGASAVIAGIFAIVRSFHDQVHGKADYPNFAMRTFLRSTGVDWASANVGGFPQLQLQHELLSTGPNAAVMYGGTVGTEEAGYYVDGAGDVDGDGFDDVIVGTFSTPQATVLSGGTGEVLYTFTSTDLYFGSAVDGAGDVNADGYDDLVIGSRSVGKAIVYSGQDGSVIHTVSGTAPFGFSVSGVGDMDGDGNDDFIVGGGGNAIVYSGADASTIYSKTAETGLVGTFGYRVRGGGDIDADGTPDFLVSASHFIQSSGTMKVYAYSGADGSLLHSWTGPGLGSFGYGLDFAGDVNGDGHDDVVVGAPFYDGLELDRGRVWVYDGQTGNQIRSWDGFGANTWFGFSVAGVGDVNGNGYDDILVGEPRQATTYSDAGRASLIEGRQGALIREYMGQGQFAGYYGWAVGSAGDLNGDGRGDLAIGAPSVDSYSGRAYTYLADSVRVQLFPQGPRSASSASVRTP